MTELISVIGAAGMTGRAVVNELYKRGKRVKPLVKKIDDRCRTPAFSGAVAADLADIDVLSECLAGTTTAYYIPPVFHSSEATFGANVLRACLNANVRRLVYHSVLHAPTPALRHHYRKAQVELLLRESPIEWTVVQPGMYTSTPFVFLDQQSGRLMPGFSCSQPFTPIDLRDLSEAICNVLTESGHERATYELAGPDRLTFEEMASVLSELLGRPVVAQKVDLKSAVAARVAARGFGEEATKDLRAMLSHYEDHGLVGNANVLRMLLRREPSSFSASAGRILDIGH